MCNLDQRGNVSLITGGSRGIGLAIAKKLYGLGLHVVITDRDSSAFDAVYEAMPGVLALESDVSGLDSAGYVVRATLAKFGQIDILVNNAGISQRDNSHLVDSNYEEFRRIMDVNINGMYRMTCAVLQEMRKRDSGYIINILSTAAFHAGAGYGLYSASKYAARSITETLIEECKGSGIRVSAISPGPVASDIWSHKTEAVAEELKNRMLRTEDIADIAAFLICTGKNVHIGNIPVTPWMF